MISARVATTFLFCFVLIVVVVVVVVVFMASNRIEFVDFVSLTGLAVTIFMCIGEIAWLVVFGSPGGR